jgi:hypothetical protein
MEDLDLEVKCPGGQVSYQSMQACGGRLDIDMNAGRKSSTPVENIIWQAPPPAGSYEIAVTMVNGTPSREIPFKVVLKRGDAVQQFTGRMPIDRTRQIVYAFDQ